MAMNPFAVDEVPENPFETSEEQSTQSNPWNTGTTTSTKNTIRAPSRTWSNDSANRPPVSIPSGSGTGKSVRELELEKREADVRLREARLAEREKALGGFKPPNWPKFRPMIYHSIDEEIPERGRWLVKRVYGAWYLAVLAYLVNAVAAFSCLVTKGEQAGGTFGLALIILLIGTPVSFVFWYRPLYNGVKNDSSISFMFFYFNYAFHLAVAALLAVGIPGWGGAGVILTISQLGKNVASGVLCGIASGILIFECIYGLWQIKNATVYFRSQGLSVQQAKNEAAVGLAQSKMGRDIAGQAVKSAMTGDMRA